MIARIGLLLSIGTLLGGCNWQTFPTSIAGGESKVFEAPPYAVKGKAQYDQRWIDSQVEGGVAAFGWKRPAPRPASIDAPVKRLAKAPAPAKKPGIIKRIKDTVTLPFSERFAPVIASPPPVVATPVQPLAPPPKPHDPVDELLQPSEPIRRVH